MRLRRFAVVLAAMLLIPVMAGCASDDTGPVTGTATSGGPRGGEGLVASWTLTSSAVSSVQLAEFDITIVFTDSTASGFAGVNQYTTTFTSGPSGDLNFGEIASTRMAGPEDAMNAEQAYLASLATVTGYTVAGDVLELYADEQEILTYSTP